MTRTSSRRSSCGRSQYRKSRSQRYLRTGDPSVFHFAFRTSSNRWSSSCRTGISPVSCPGSTTRRATGSGRAS
eukprot:11211863-Lingulodinium_polyedra.AAC.1